MLLAIIGQQWTTITDESGRRRLDNPDDQLRIEVATAMERRITVIPVLIHGAELPGPEKLPPDIAALAKAEPIEIQSGLPFNTDVQKLIDRLEQKHGLRHPDRRFPLQLVLIPLGILLTVAGSLPPRGFPSAARMRHARLRTGFVPQGMDYSLAGYQQAIRDMILYCTIPLGLGPLLIVLGNRWCCVNKEAPPRAAAFLLRHWRSPDTQERQGGFVSGIWPGVDWTGPVAAIPAIVLGIWAFLDIRQRTGWVRGRSLAVIGLLAALAGGIGTTYLHVSYWRFHALAPAGGTRRTALASGDGETALAAYQRAIDAYPGNAFRLAVSRLARGDPIAAGKYPAAVEELTAVVADFESWAGEPAHVNEKQVLSEAYRKRADVYRLLGDDAEGRRRPEPSRVHSICTT